MSNEVVPLASAGVSGLSFLLSIEIPSVQNVAYGVAIFSGIFSIANVAYGWIKDKRKKNAG